MKHTDSNMHEVPQQPLTCMSPLTDVRLQQDGIAPEHILPLAAVPADEAQARSRLPHCGLRRQLQVPERHGEAPDVHSQSGREEDR